MIGTPKYNISILLGGNVQESYEKDDNDDNNNKTLCLCAKEEAEAVRSHHGVIRSTQD